MDKNCPLVSVVMPAYNAEKYITAATSSVLEQTYENLELIIVNDCSKDHTLQVIQNCAKKDSRIRVLSNEENLGVSYTRQRGVETADGEWIAFLDSDDMWAPDKLEKQIEAQRKSNADLIFTGSGFMDDDGNRKDWILHVPEQVSYRTLLKQNIISNSSVLIRKSAYKKCAVLGGYMLHEDFACWLQYLRQGGRVCGIDEPLLIYRLAANSKSGNKWKAAKMNWNTYRVSGLSVFEAAYYMVFYTINGLLKYKNLR